MRTKIKVAMLAGGLLASCLSILPQPTLAATGGAVWQNNGGRTIATGLTNMQDITQENFSQPYCGSDKDDVVAVGATLQLTDKRDDKTYKIMKMNDGKCWMVENLRLPGGTSLDSTNSDVTSAYTLPDNQAINNEINNWGTDKTSQNMAEGSSSMKINGSGAWNTAYGNYYSWCTATAGTCTDSGDAPSSICPKGWTLPSNTDTNIGTYSKLNEGFAGSWTTIGGVNGIKLGYNSNDAFFPAAGLVDGDGLNNSGSNGYYWSSTVRSSNVSYAYFLNFSSGYVNPSYSSLRYYGSSVRCVAAPPSDPSSVLPSASADANLNVIVNPTLSLSLSTNSVSLAAESDKIVTGKIGASVTANQQFSIGFSTAAGQTMLSATTSGNSNSIPAKDNLQDGELGWGVQKKLSATDTGTRGDATDTGIYSAVGDGTPITFYRSAAGSDGTSPLDFIVGIGVTPNLNADTYSTTVTVTATAG